MTTNAAGNGTGNGQFILFGGYSSGISDDNPAVKGIDLTSGEKSPDGILFKVFDIAGNVLATSAPILVTV